MGRHAVTLSAAACALLALVAAFTLELTRPRLLLVGNVTVDLVNGVKSPGGAVVYAAAVARAWGVRACIVTAASGSDAELEVFSGHELHVVPSDKTLTFEHTYTLWGSHRKLRVTAQPNVTLSMEHVPARCRSAPVVLLGPLMPEDLDPTSFARYTPPLWQRALGLGAPLVGLMAQGLQRGMDPTGRVVALSAPHPALEASLGPRTTVFLSDVEVDSWANGTVDSLAGATRAFLVTRGSAGADELAGGRQRRHSPYPVDEVVDTNGAGDCFATGYALAAAAGHEVPGAVANWVAAMSVTQPQSCKPDCVVASVRQHWQSMPRARGGSRWGPQALLLWARPRLQHLAQHLVAGPPKP